SLIVSLLSNKYKSVEFVKINLDNHFKPTSLIKNYELKSEDMSQSPYEAYKVTPKCPDETVQFVIGNNFTGDSSVKKEVLKVYELAKEKGYNPYLMDTNNSSGPQPTVQAYEDWLSCPNVKGFYNESHGWSAGIVLSDGEFIDKRVHRELIDKLNHEVILFDSC